MSLGANVGTKVAETTKTEILWWDSGVKCLASLPTTLEKPTINTWESNLQDAFMDTHVPQTLKILHYQRPLSGQCWLEC